MLGGYAGYIIPAYAVSSIVILALVIWPALTYRRCRAEIDRLEKSGARRRSRSQ